MAANTIDRARLRRLADARPERGRVLSVFLNLDPSQFATAPARASAITSVVDEAQRRVKDCAGLDHDEQAWLRGDVERVRDALQGGDIAEDGARAVAVFACEPLDLLEVVTLRRPLDSRVVVERTPCVEPLIPQADGERWVVVLANRRSARIFQGSAAALEETDRIEDEVHQQHDQGGWSQMRYQRSVEKDKNDHLAHVAEVLFSVYKRRGFEHLVIGGPEEILGDVERHLHTYLQERILGRVHIDVENSRVEDVRAAVAEELEAHETRREREALDRLAEGVGRGTRGAAGVADVLAALNEARVDTLLVASGFAAAGQRDRETGLLYAEAGAPPARALERVDDVVEPAIEKALEQSATVLRVSRHDDLGPLGGIGAVLRY
jgi:protein required for attachment to host cells